MVTLIPSYEVYAKYRDMQRLTDYQVANACGISPATLSAWKMTGTRPSDKNCYYPKLDKISAIANVIGVNVADLLKEVEKDDRKNVNP